MGGSSRGSSHASAVRLGFTSSSQSSFDARRDLCPIDQERWARLTCTSFEQYEQSKTVLLRSADQAAATVADKAVSYKAHIARQAAEESHRVAELQGQAHTVCTELRNRLLDMEEALFKQLGNQVVDLFMHLRQACREFSEQNAAMNVGRNTEIELMGFNNKIKQTIKDKKDFLELLHSGRRAELERWCDTLVADIQAAVYSALYPDDASTADGSLSDLLDGESTIDGSVTDILDASALGDTADLMSTRQTDGMADGSITDILSTFDTVLTMSSCFSSATVRSSAPQPIATPRLADRDGSLVTKSSVDTCDLLADDASVC